MMGDTQQKYQSPMRQRNNSQYAKNEMPQFEETKKFSNGLFSEFQDRDQLAESGFPLNVSNNREIEIEDQENSCNLNNQIDEYKSGMKTQQLSELKLSKRISEMAIDMMPQKDVNSTQINIQVMPKQITKYNSKRDKMRNKKQFKSDYQEKSKTLNEILTGDEEENFYSGNMKADFLEISNDHDIADQNNFKDIDISTPKGTGPNSMCRSTTTASRTIHSKKQVINDSIAAIKHQSQLGNNSIVIQPQHKFITPNIQYKSTLNKQNKTSETQPVSQKQSLPEIPSINNKFIKKSPQNNNFSVIDTKVAQNPLLSQISKPSYIGTQILLRGSSQSPKYIREYNLMQRNMNPPFSNQAQQLNQPPPQLYNPYQNIPTQSTAVVNPPTKFISKNTAINLHRHQSPLVNKIVAENTQTSDEITQQLINQISKVNREGGTTTSLGQRQLISKIINRERQLAIRKDQISI